ncbi:hypothetical protein FIV31_05885 [Coxiella endosymbiont of Ornithodoros amblus]|uniref:hypothetical protein n=1 Tax=Coxiella endosymbiont of Ornithodoros amblus TaxID=1656166 RepID=UPI00244E0D18|nr:hypothetical protein [Coxiella endosymbiont of Ornithodoros amblus]MBW5802897.1 hypothetical protein [Coxiella endosymbiont of Ornithodoros amblus]
MPRDEIGTEYHQEINLDRLFDDVSVYNEWFIVTEQMPRIGLLVVKTAIVRQGVAHLFIIY